MKRILVVLLSYAGLLFSPVLAGEAWDQARAKELVAEVLEVEKSGTRPWNGIPWRVHAENAIRESKATGKPLLVFFYVAQAGPPREPCGLEGRLMRTFSLSDSKVIELIKSQCVPVKIQLREGQDYPLNWPALKK